MDAVTDLWVVDEETEGEKHCIIHLKVHSSKVAELGFELRYSGSTVSHKNST